MFSEFLKGTLSTIILSLLKEEGKMYGYEICQKVSEYSDQTINITEGSIYPALHKLEKKGLIVASTQLINGRTRKYYALSPSQQESAEKQIASLKVFIEKLKTVVE